MKVTVVGAGNVGATCADVLATREIANEIDKGSRADAVVLTGG